MSRHLPTYGHRIGTDAGSIQINTSPWRATKRPIWLHIGIIANNFTAAEARAIGRMLIEAADHAESVRQRAAVNSEGVAA